MEVFFSLIAAAAADAELLGDFVLLCCRFQAVVDMHVQPL
jgi:hypothetical protein